MLQHIGMDKNLIESLPDKIICCHEKCKSIATFHDHVNKKTLLWKT